MNCCIVEGYLSAGGVRIGFDKFACLRERSCNRAKNVPMSEGVKLTINSATATAGEGGVCRSYALLYTDGATNADEATHLPVDAVKCSSEGPWLSMAGWKVDFHRKMFLAMARAKGVEAAFPVASTMATPWSKTFDDWNRIIAFHTLMSAQGKW